MVGQAGFSPAAPSSHHDRGRYDQHPRRCVSIPWTYRYVVRCRQSRPGRPLLSDTTAEKAADTATRQTLQFSVDSALLRELGERLVGAPHIALAELIKNAYDADATRCIVKMRGDEIEVVDNGHGMTFDELRNFWMRVGSPHKEQQRTSRNLGRPLTGSKGVGRLAVQFLARRLRMETRSNSEMAEGLRVEVDWNDAVQAGDLQQATADCWRRTEVADFACESPHGLRIVLRGLNQQWDSDSLKNLARQVWMLRPPDFLFGKRSGDGRSDFDIDLETPDQEALEEFQQWQETVFGRWIAKITGRIRNGRHDNSEELQVFFKDKHASEPDEVHRETFPVAAHGQDCHISEADWQILVFDLSGHLGGRIKVGDARDYFRRYGGVGLYDESFRLPYYGAEQDWLGIEHDHSHRKVRSQLLPQEMHAERALNDLPTQGRILGAVFISTGSERRAAGVDNPSDSWLAEGHEVEGDYLRIQVTRDRLVSNKAYEQLRDAVRRSIDWYAVLARRRRLEQARMARPHESPSSRLERLNEVISGYEAAIPADARKDIVKAVDEFVDSAEREQDYRDALMGLVGPLASAGMAAVAVEHETAVAMRQLRKVAERIEEKAEIYDDKELKDTGRALGEVIDRVEAGRAVFAPLLSQEDREEVERYRAKAVVEEVIRSLSFYLNNISIETQVQGGLRLPESTYAEWHGLLQNVIVNAVNAMDHSEERRLRISGGTGPGRRAWLRLSDTGRGIDIEKSERFFEPFARGRSKVRELGFGGTGLGLTIVRMIADRRRCRVSFVEPDPGFSTTFELAWTPDLQRGST